MGHSSAEGESRIFFPLSDSGEFFTEPPQSVSGISLIGLAVGPGLSFFFEIALRAGPVGAAAVLKHQVVEIDPFLFETKYALILWWIRQSRGLLISVSR